jgi:hypothetical protein
MCARLETELLGLSAASRKSVPAEVAAVRRSWHFSDNGPATIVCAQLPTNEAGSLTDPADPNYTELLSYADLDALMELHGHIRAENPMMDVFYKISSRVVLDDLVGHVVLLGGIAWSDFTRRSPEMINLPVRQITDPPLRSDEIFIAEVDRPDRRFRPGWRNSSRAELTEDVGLLARLSNPLNSNRSLTLCNGIYSRGVFGVVRCLTDARLRDSNELYIMANFGDSDSFMIIMRVPIIHGRTMSPDLGIADSVLYQWPSEANKR